MNRRIAVSCLVLTGLFAVSRADAQSASERAAADALFEEGIGLRNSGDHAAACDRFERSQSIDPALGTLQNIGMCLEKQGKMVAALSRFGQLLRDSERGGDNERIRVARKRLARLRRKVPKLKISVPRDSEISGLVILVNSDRLQDALLGIEAPMDPGHYVVSARAPKHKTWSKSVDLAMKQKVKIVVPPLERLAETVTSTSEGSETASTPAESASILDSQDEGPSAGDRRDGRKLGVGLSGGASFLSLGDLDLATQAAVTVEASWRLRAGGVRIDVGGMASATAFFWAPPQGEAKQTRLVSFLGNVTLSRALGSKFSLRAQGGGGVLVLMGLDEPDHPLLKTGVTSVGVINLPQVRVAIGGDFELTPGLKLVIHPLVYWYSPGVDAFAPNVDSLSGLQSMAGASYLF